VDLVDDTHLERGFSLLVICLSFVCDGESYSGGGGRSSRLDAAHAFISGGGDEGLEVSKGRIRSLSRVTKTRESQIAGEIIERTRLSVGRMSNDPLSNSNNGTVSS
jgi:hypothetical protein